MSGPASAQGKPEGPPADIPGDMPGDTVPGAVPPDTVVPDAVVPGQVVHGDAPIPLNPGRERRTVRVVNTADRPIQVGSHYHFAAANPGLDFDREAAWGMRLDVPAGTAIRFEPGIERDVPLVPLGGHRIVPGLRPEWAGPLDGRSHE